MGNRIEDVLALALLYGLENKNEARVASVSVSKSNLKAAALADAISRFYVTAAMGQFSSFARTLPVGLSLDGKMRDDTPLLAIADKHANSVRKMNDTAECDALIRNALTAQNDGNAAVVLAGPATNLARVLTLAGAKDVIARKVKMLVISDPETNESIDPAAAKKVMAEWPTPIVICGREIGEALKYPGSSIETDFSWAPSHPVVDAYRAAGTMPYDAPGSDMAAVLYAVRPQEKYFQVQDRRLLLDPSQKDRIVKAYAELVSAKPVPRRPRFGQAVAEPEKPKPAAAPPKP